MRFAIVLSTSLLLAGLSGCQDRGCDCIPKQSSGWYPEGPTCGESLCPTVIARGGEHSSYEIEFELETPEALECALNAVRDRTPGIINYDWDYDIGQFTKSGYILIDEDGTAVFRSWSNNDLSFDVSDAAVRELKPAESYARCLDDPSAEARLECLITPGLVVETCAGGWSEDWDI